jgi:hypothetical protein
MRLALPRPAIAVLGAAAIAEAVAFNLAFGRLAASFDYPDILRRPAAEVLDAFVAGGPALVLTWYAFALSALAMVPLALGLALSGGTSAARVSAAVLGALAGTVQAIGLVRWVFAVPMLAQLGDGREAAFLILNQWGGVGVGEHLGYLLTAGFLAAMAIAELGEGARIRPAVALVSAAAMVAGSWEGVALALGTDGSLFGLAAVVGYLGLSAWLVMEGAVWFLPGRAPRLLAA